MALKTETIILRCSPDFKRRVRKAAERLDISMANYIKAAVVSSDTFPIDEEMALVNGED